MSCILHVIGTDFQPLDFLSNEAFHPDQIITKGVTLRRKKTGELFDYSGFKVRIGPDTMDSFSKQLAACREFIASHRAACERLAAFPGVEDRRLDVGIDMGSRFMLSVTFPDEFTEMVSTLRMSLEVSVYAGNSREYEAKLSPGARIDLEQLRKFIPDRAQLTVMSAVEATITRTGPGLILSSILLSDDRLYLRFEHAGKSDEADLRARIEQWLGECAGKFEEL